MTQAGVYGQRLGQGLRSKQAPVLITRSLHSAELAVTEVRNDEPTPDISGSLAAEDAYLLSLKLRDYPDCECWERPLCHQGGYSRRRDLSVRPQARSALCDRQAVSLALLLFAALGARQRCEATGRAAHWRAQL